MSAASPEGLIELVGSVMAAVGAPGPWLIERVPVGQSNHVYRVADRSGRAFAVRIGRTVPSRFPSERAAMLAAEVAGVPVPSIRHVGEVVHQGSVVPVMVTTWVEAPRLSDAFPRANGDAPGSLVRSIAEALARTHSVEVGGFGNLDAALNSPYERFDEWFLGGLDARIEASHAAVRHDPVLGNEPALHTLIDRAVTHLDGHRAELSGGQPRLVHGDVSPANLLVDLRHGEPTLSVLLDWESAKGGPAALDFGWWDHVGGADLVPTEQLIAAYEAELGIRLDDVDLVRRLVRIRILVTELGWLAAADPPRSLVPTARALADLLDAL